VLPLTASGAGGGCASEADGGRRAVSAARGGLWTVNFQDGGYNGLMQDWIAAVMDRLGVVGVGILIALENLVPPIPSEVILPLAGFRANTGTLNPVAVWVAATLGALVGAWCLYALGAWLGYDRLERLSHKKWFIIASPSDVERGQRIFDRHGSWIVAAARCVPVLRSLVSLPAGVVRMPLIRFSLLTILGAGVWNAIFIAAGWQLADRWELVQRYSAPVSAVIIALILGTLVWLVIRKFRQGNKTLASTRK
jgi:membrane protein DedA with SNARE-associated domain